LVAAQQQVLRLSTQDEPELLGQLLALVLVVDRVVARVPAGDLHRLAFLDSGVLLRGDLVGGLIELGNDLVPQPRLEVTLEGVAPHRQEVGAVLGADLAQPPVHLPFRGSRERVARATHALLGLAVPATAATCE